jgi:hypothetical protein
MAKNWVTRDRLAAASMVIACFGSGASLAGGVQRTDAPVWVEELPIPAPRTERLREIHDGRYSLLRDTQVSMEGNVETVYSRRIYKITDREGLEDGGRLEIEFDPSDEDLLLHRIAIHRNGAVLDRLRGTKVQVLQREDDLDSGVVTGLKTVHVEIGDVRVGDVVDVAYSWRIARKLWTGAFFEKITTSWAVPVGLERYRLIWPAERPLVVRRIATTLSPAITRGSSRTFYDWMVKDPDPVPTEDGTPSWYARWGYISLSSMTSWGEVVRATLPLYADKLRLSPDLVRQADEIAARNPDPVDKITQVLRLVQDRLRYVSLSIGKGSYVPRLPEEAFRSGYGDCKDKAVLLAALLVHFGFDANVALTHADDGPRLPEEAPSPTAFDHAIVRLRWRGQSWWLEPTWSQQGGRFPNLSPVEYRYALPLVQGQENLESIPFPAPSKPTTRSTERYDLSQGPNLSLRLHVATIYDGVDADWMRGNIAYKSLSSIERDYLKFYGDLYPGLVLAEPLRMTDDRSRNEMVTYESYVLAAAALKKNGLMRKFEVKASSFNDYEKPDDGRRTPFKLPFPINRRHTTVVHTPGYLPPSPKDYSVDGIGFSWQLNSHRAGDVLTLNYKVISKKEVLAPGEIAQYRKDVDDMDNGNYWYLDLASKDGGYIADGDTNVVEDSFDELSGFKNILALSLIPLMMAMFGGGLFALNRALHADDAYARSAFFYPVDVKKFILMSIATAGLYSVYWMWKCWRWVKIDQASHVLPFWRALFGFVWLYPLFAEVNRRSTISTWTRTLGIGAAVLFTLLIVPAEIAWFSWHSLTIQLGFRVLQTVFVLPTVLSVNALNSAQAKVRSKNSCFTWLTATAIAYGLLDWSSQIWLAAKPWHGLIPGH